MSILIRGMEMPIGCASCFVDRAYCRLWKKVPCGKWRDERHPNCPLIELPPHGRLGDLDELKTAFPRCDNSMDIKIASVRATIDHAPTIIKAEGET